jgi:carboxylesterase type B
MPDTVTVTVAQGILRGKKVTAKTGTTYFSFQGIPYCQSPVGPLRFKVRLTYFGSPSI